MNIQDKELVTIINKINYLGVKLFVKDDKLGYKSKTKNLDKNILKLLSENKKEIINHLLFEQKRTQDPFSKKYTSLSQQRIWLIEKISSNTGEFNIPININLLGNWTLSEIKNSLSKLIREHDILRSIYLEEGEILWQQVNQHVDLPFFEVINLSEVESSKLEVTLNQHLTDCSNHEFNLTTEIPIRAKVFLLPNNEKTLNLTIHHIALDESSCKLLLQQLLDNVATQNASEQLPQYCEYAEWQKQNFLSKDFQERAEEYVKSLTGVPALHALPLLKAHSSNTTNYASTIKSAVPETLYRKIKLLKQEHSLTTFAFYQTCIAKFLSIWTNTDDVVMGTPAIHRPTERASSMLGCFLNLLVIRHKFSIKDSLIDLLSNAGKQHNDLLSYQDVPFEHLLSKLTPHRTPYFTPIFQILVSMHQHNNNDPSTDNESDNHSWQYRGQKTNTTKYDLTIKICSDGNDTYLAWQYKTDLFSQNTIEQLALTFNHFLEQAIETPEKALAQMPLSTDSHAAKLINSHSQSTKEFDKLSNILKTIEKNGNKNPKAIAIEFSSKTFTYSEVISRTNYLANKLVENGIKRGDRVAVMMQRSPQMLFSMLAIMKVGAAYVPLDPDYPLDRLNYIFETAHCKSIIQDENNHHHFFHTNILSIGNNFFDDIETETYRYTSTIDLDDSAYIIFTSGSTGVPKGVEITHSNLNNFIHSMLNSPGITQSDKLLAVTPISFDISILELFAPLVAGGSVVIAEQDKRDGHSIKQRLEKNDISIMQATPATWQSIIDAKWIGSKTLKSLCGGETLSSELANKLLPKVESLWNMYGPTEATIWSTCHKVSQQTESKIGLGMPINNTGIYIIDEHDNFCPFEKQGEIIITGDGVAKGYFNQPELTKQRFFTLTTSTGSTRAYRTGDLGYISQDKELFCHGRNDHQVKLRGFRIEIPEIEHQIMRIVGIDQACVVVKILPNETKKLVAYVVTSQTGPIPISKSITAQMQDVLPSYMLPDSIEIITELPLTPSGKIDRNYLTELPFDGHEKTYQPPSNKIESLLVDIWQNCLKKKSVGITDNFFNSGGDSILAVRAVSAVTSAGYQMSNTMIFTYQTIKELAVHLSEKKTYQEKILPVEQKVNGIEVLGDDISESDLNSLLCEFE